MCVECMRTDPKEKDPLGERWGFPRGDWKVPSSRPALWACALEVKRGRAPRKHFGQNSQLMRHDWYHEEGQGGTGGHCVGTALHSFLRTTVS